MQADRLDLPRRAIRVETAAADAGRWAALPETGDWRPVGVGRSFDGPFTGRRLEWKGSLVCPGSSGQALLVAALPNIPYTGRGGSGPVDDVGGPGG
ncbi:hypothetical protein [Candidatus Amarolinea dominans]|uniref:hypothetical protein n=1 Tax=Candidatus Amarolinea dominans TaxID=3140696 RepID=UPI003134C89A|nr:hypothetical protein [Anaerolineae bacterium]